MRYIVMVKASKESEAGVMPTKQMLDEMGKFNAELVKAGIMLAGEGLTPSSQGTRITFKGKDRTVVDGPFAETKELVSGFWILQARSKDEVIEWIKRAPFGQDAEVEIRRVFEAEDFGPELTPEARAAEEKLRSQVAAQAKK